MLSSSSLKRFCSLFRFDIGANTRLVVVLSLL